MHSLDIVVYSVQHGYCTVQCIVYSLQFTAWILQCTVYSVQHGYCTVQCTVYSMDIAQYSVQCTAWILQCTVYSMNIAVYSVQFTKKHILSISSPISVDLLSDLVFCFQWFNFGLGLFAKVW